MPDGVMLEYHSELTATGAADLAVGADFGMDLSVDAAERVTTTTRLKTNGESNRNYK